MSKTQKAGGATSTDELTEMTEPGFVADYSLSYTAGEAHAFALHGDVGGYVAVGYTPIQYLGDRFADKDRIVLRYDCSAAIRFWDDDSALPVMRKQAIELLLEADGGVAQETPGGASGNGLDFSQVFAAAGLGGGALGGGTAGAGDYDPFAEAGRPAQALPLIDRLLRLPEAKGQIAVIIEYADFLAPQADKAMIAPAERTLLVGLLRLATDPAIARSNNLIFLVCQRLEDLHQDLRAASSGWKAIYLPLPDRDQRKSFIQQYLAARKQAGKSVATLEMPLDELANMTAGLSLRHIEDIILRGVKLGAVSRQLVKARKDEIIKSEYSEVAEMIEPLPQGFEALGGAGNLIAWAQDALVDAVRNGRTNDIPKGVLFVGPPGTGKTMFVKALAKELGYNAVALNAANILGKYVGESEGKLKRFLAFVRVLAPCIVFVDELDQSDMAARGNNSGNPVASNLFNQLLQFMSDETLRGKVVMLFATNRPDLLDPALLRFGRMDDIIPVLLPERAAREEIIMVQAQLQNALMDPQAITWLAEKTEKYSAADLGGLVAKARKKAASGRGADETPRITQEHTETAFGLIRPATLSKADYYTLLAVQACNDLEHLPEKYRKLMASPQDLLKAKRAAETEAGLRDTGNGGNAGSRDTRDERNI